MTAHKFYLFLSIFLSPFIPFWATVTRPMLSILAKAVSYQTRANRMAGRPEENVEKCAGGGNARDMERLFHVSSFWGLNIVVKFHITVIHEGSYRLHNSPSLLPVQGHITTDHLLTPYSVRAYFNIIPPSIPRFTRLSLFFPIFTKIFTHSFICFIYNSTVLSIILISYLGSCLALCFYLFLQFFNAGLEQREQSSIIIQLREFYDIMLKL